MLVNKSIVQTWTNALANDQLADVELQVLALNIFVTLCYMKKKHNFLKLFKQVRAGALVSLVMSGSLTICIHLSPIMCVFPSFYMSLMSLRLVVTGSVRV